MRFNWVVLSALGLAAGLLSGCVGTVDGRHRAGVPLVSDQVTSLYERSAADIWTAAKDVLRYNGTIRGEDAVRATLEGSVDNRTVWVRVLVVDQNVSRVTVQARTKGGGGDVKLASEMDKQIALRLATGNLTPAAKPAAKP